MLDYSFINLQEDEQLCLSYLESQGVWHILCLDFKGKNFLAYLVGNRVKACFCLSLTKAWCLFNETCIRGLPIVPLVLRLKSCQVFTQHVISKVPPLSISCGLKIVHGHLNKQYSKC